MGSSAIEGVPALGSGGGGAVTSVATRTGDVVLTAADVGAGQLPAGVLLPSGVAIPSGASAATQAANDNSTKVATTAYADAIAALKANLASPAFTGHPTGVTETPGDNSTRLASTAYADAIAALKANINSQAFTGTPSLPTGATGVKQAAGDNSAKFATTSYVDSLVANALSGVQKVVYRSADGSAITANTTLASDAVLLFAIAANEVWEFRARLILACTGAADDVKMGWAVPASCTMLWGAEGSQNNNLNAWGACPAASTPLALLDQTQNLQAGSASLTLGITLGGVVTNSTNAGNVNLQLAQVTSQATSITLKKGSCILATRLA